MPKSRWGNPFNPPQRYAFLSYLTSFLLIFRSIVNEVAFSVIDGDADVAEALVEMDVNRVLVGTGYDGVGTGIAV